MKHVLLTMFLVVVLSVVCPAAHVWVNDNGSGNHLWNTASNWNPNSTPTTAYHVEIGYLGLTNYCEIVAGDNAQGNNIEIANSNYPAAGYLKMTGGTLTQTGQLRLGNVSGMSDFAVFEMTGGLWNYPDKFMLVANVAGSKGHLIMSGNAATGTTTGTTTKKMNLGQYGIGKMTIRDNAYFRVNPSGGFNLGNQSGAHGILNMEGGTIEIIANGNLNVGVAGGSTGQIFMDGGLIIAPNLNMGSAAFININGGTIKLEGDDTGSIQSFIDLGVITAHSGRAEVINVHDSGYTLITAPDIGDVNYDQAWSPDPYDDKVYVDADQALTWKLGKNTDVHYVYFGTDAKDVNTDQPLSGDADLSGSVDILDIRLMADNWLQTVSGDYPNPDVYGDDDFVNFKDFAVVAAQLNTSNTFKGMQTIDNNSFDPGALDYGQTYYWRIDEVNQPVTYQGQLWSFTTTPEDPRIASEPSPADFGEGTGTANIVLSWTPGENALSHEVYFGTNEQDVTDANNTWPLGGVYKGPQTATTYSTGNLTYNQTYYWRIDENDGSKLHRGRIWSFTAVDYGLDFGIKRPRQLYAVDFSNLTDQELVSAQTLQGVIAQQRPEIFIWKDNDNGLWLRDMGLRYDINVTYVADVKGAYTEYQWLVNHYKNDIAGYVLYDPVNYPKSVCSATSMAGILNAIAVDIDLESTVQALGLSMVFDARGKDTTWVFNNYWNDFTHRAIAMKDDDVDNLAVARRLRDLGPALKAMTAWTSSSSTMNAIYDAMVDNSPWFGFDDPASGGSELTMVNYHSSYDLYTLPCDWSLNFSYYTGLAALEPRIQFDQKLPEPNSYTTESNVHYVTFIHSDMDNINLLTNGSNWAAGADRYGSPYRGQFAMGWGMSPSMIKMAPAVMKWWYDNAIPNKDCFMVPFSGMGYTHPSYMTASGKAKQCQQLGRFMAEGDLKTVWMKDYTYGGGTTFANYLAAIPVLRGVFVSGEPYDDFGDDIRWYGDKPFISTKYRLWDGSQSPSSLISNINSRPTNPTIESGYTAVVVHAWSYTMDDVKYIVDNLDSDVRVVTPEEMVEQVRLNNVNR